MSRELTQGHRARYGLIWLIGIETGLRISDIVALPVSARNGAIWRVREQKTGKTRVVEISRGLLGYLRLAEPWNKISPWLFPSRRDPAKHVSRVQVWRVFKSASERIGLDGVGTHSMRKTFAVRHWEKHGDLAALQAILGHKYISTTLLYVFGHRV